jgi:hypothetical protein
MRNLFIVCILVVVGLMAANTATAADQVPQATLQAMGLGNMQVVSDARGTEIRGKFINLFDRFQYSGQAAASWGSSYGATAQAVDSTCCPSFVYANSSASASLLGASASSTFVFAR